MISPWKAGIEQTILSEQASLANIIKAIRFHYLAKTEMPKNRDDKKDSDNQKSFIPHLLHYSSLLNQIVLFIMVLMFNKLPVFILIFAFSAIAVFGFLAMNDGHSHSGCLAATASGGKCPVETAIAVDFHTNVFKSFSLATLVSGLALIILSAFVAGLVKNLETASENFRFSFLRRRNMDLRLAPAPREVFRWNIFHQNSPSVF